MISTVMGIVAPLLKIGAIIFAVMNASIIVPILLAVGLIKSFINQFKPLFDVLDEIGSMFGAGDGGGIMGAIMGIGEFIGNFFLSPIKMIASYIKGALMPIIEAVKGIFSSIGEVIDTVKGAFTGGGGGGPGLMDIIEKVGGFVGTFLAIPLKMIAWIISNVLVPAIEIILIPFQLIWEVIKGIGDAIDTYMIQPIDRAIDALSNLNPMNWFSSEDEPGAVVEAMAKGGTAKGGLTLVGEEGPELVTLPGGAQVAPAGDTDNLLSTVTDLAKKAFSFTPMGMASGALGSMGSGGGDVEPSGEEGGGVIDGLKKAFSFTPMGMAADAIGGIFGGGDDEESTDTTEKVDPLLSKLDDVILAIQNMEINMDGQKVGKMTRLADSFRGN